MCVAVLGTNSGIGSLARRLRRPQAAGARRVRRPNRLDLQVGVSCTIIIAEKSWDWAIPSEDGAHMRLAYAFLANFAEWSEEGRFSLLGGGFTLVKAPSVPFVVHTMSLVVGVQVPREHSGQ